MKDCKNADGSKPCEEPHCFCPPPRGTSQSGQTDAAPRASGAKTVSREATPAVAAPFADTLDVMSGRVPSAARFATPAENMEALYARLNEHMSPAEQRELQEVVGILACTLDKYKSTSAESAAATTFESERAALVAEVGECCMGRDPLCAGGCLVQQAIRKRSAPSSEAVATEPTENEMCDAARYFIAYCETPGRTFEGARKHLACAGVDFESTWPVWALGRTGHLTKSAVAALIWHMMQAAAPSAAPAAPVAILKGPQDHATVVERVAYICRQAGHGDYADAIQRIYSALSATGGRMQFNLDDDAVRTLKEWINDGDGGQQPITLFSGDGHNGPGLYVALTEYPEEGAAFICAADRGNDRG